MEKVSDNYADDVEDKHRADLAQEREAPAESEHARRRKDEEKGDEDVA